MKKALSLILALCLFFTMTVPAFAIYLIEPIGYVALSVDANTLGAGYIYEPILVPFYEGETAADITERYIGKDNITVYTGEWGEYINGFRLQNNININLPTEIQAELNANGKTLGSGSSKAGEILSEFDFYSTSGWVFMVNDEFAPVGASEFYPDDGDAIRWQFSLFWSRDLGMDATEWGGDPPILTPADKAALIYEVAKINSADNKADMLKNSAVAAAYAAANTALANLSCAQADVDSALAALQAAVKNFDEEENLSFFGKIAAFFRNIFENIQRFFENLFK